MSWNRKLWGILFLGGDRSDPILIGGMWEQAMKRIRYDGEPTRALVFMTRKDARKWCAVKNDDYAHSNDSIVRKWRCKVVRVSEVVKQIGGKE